LADNPGYQVFVDYNFVTHLKRKHFEFNSIVTSNVEQILVSSENLNDFDEDLSSFNFTGSSS
jgi:hypothetical protein